MPPKKDSKAFFYIKISSISNCKQQAEYNIELIFAHFYHVRMQHNHNNKT